ncbi:phosphatidylinositol-4-phosphate 5-kinase its3 [Sugiyamaella lignohabitans]|uniref:Phosphatidylinositol-4-phosphate 5-kinase its3 n=1 Tax=Sugiyamaella lignohabitans TaxID=796027 RepID=A0A167D115_9ASCO|nr:phosphatidylinositol-4-phosphate 5-kinase its3 [Sugiyamaella lignohabitans]ANB12345.1 phosphatidylinositol-4-phosphate 5-kinase its3 [Sugiyamaella lignohabitans]
MGSFGQLDSTFCFPLEQGEFESQRQLCKFPRRPVLNDVRRPGSGTYYGNLGEIENRRPARRSAFAYHKTIQVPIGYDFSVQPNKHLAVSTEVVEADEETDCEELLLNFAPDDYSGSRDSKGFLCGEVPTLLPDDPLFTGIPDCAREDDDAYLHREFINASDDIETINSMNAPDASMGPVELELECALTRVDKRFENLGIIIEEILFDMPEKVSKMASLKSKLAFGKRPSISGSTLFTGILTGLCANPPLYAPGVPHSSIYEVKKYQLQSGAILGVHSPVVYNQIRAVCGVDHDELMSSFDLQSLDAAITERTGSEFVTPDGKFNIKTLKRKEYQMISDFKFLDDYYTHVRDLLTRLPPYLGHYTIWENGKETHFVVTKSLVDKNNDTLFKLRASTDGDLNGFPRVVIKDLNRLNDKYFHLPENVRDHIIGQVRTDAKMLKRHNILDYSLLVGLECDPLTGEETSSVGLSIALCPSSRVKRVVSCIRSLISGHSTFKDLRQSASANGPSRPVVTRC